LCCMGGKAGSLLTAKSSKRKRADPTFQIMKRKRADPTFQIIGFAVGINKRESYLHSQTVGINIGIRASPFFLCEDSGWSLRTGQAPWDG